MHTKVEYDATISVTRTDCLVTGTVFQYDRGAKIQRMKISCESTIHRVTFASDRENIIPELLKAGIEVERTGEDSIWAKAPSCSSCAFFSCSDVSILGTRSVNSHNVAYRIRVSSMARLKVLERELNSLDLNPVITDIYETIKTKLTDREREALETCYREGFFDQNRKKNLSEISKIMGISPASMSELLRRAMKKVLSEYLNDLD